MQTPGEAVALAALLLPWTLLTAFLPMPLVIGGLSLLAALALLLLVAVRWSRTRAAALGLDPDTWGLATVLSLGYAMALLIGTEGRSAFQALCGECGRMQDARNAFCYGCGAHG